MTTLSLWPQCVADQIVLRPTRSDDVAVSLPPRAAHALRTCGIKLGVALSIQPGMDEATQLHVTFLIQGQLELLDCQALVMLRRVRRKGIEDNQDLAGCVRGDCQKGDFSMVTVIASCLSCARKIKHPSSTC